MIFDLDVVNRLLMLEHIYEQYISHIYAVHAVIFDILLFHNLSSQINIKIRSRNCCTTTPHQSNALCVESQKNMQKYHSIIISVKTFSTCVLINHVSIPSFEVDTTVVIELVSCSK